MNNVKRSRIRVLGPNIMQPPLLESEDASAVEFYDGFDELIALFVRINDEMWGLVTKNDPDWYDVLVRYGYRQPNGTPMEILRRIRT